MTPSSAPGRARLLIIDDEPLVGVALERTLHREYDVVTAQSAKEALRFITEGQRFDLIICDLMMPVMSGADFYKTLGKTSPDLQKRVIFLTGGAFTPQARAFLDSVPSRWYEKPLHPSVLRQLVSQLVTNEDRES